MATQIRTSFFVSMINLSEGLLTKCDELKIYRSAITLTKH